MDRRAFLPWLAFAVMTVIWGSTFLAIRVGAEEGHPPLVAAASRLLLAGFLLSGLVLALRLPWPRDRAGWFAAVAHGSLNLGVNLGLLYWGETQMSSALAAVFWGSFPVLTALLAALMLSGREPLEARKLLGGLVGFAGIAVVFQSQLSFDVPPLAMLAVLGGIVVTAVSGVVVKGWGGSVHPLALNAAGTFIGAAILLPAALVAGEPLALPPTPAAWGALLYLALAGSMGAFVLWAWLLKRWPATKTSFSALLNPLIAVALGALVLGEAISPTFALGTALVLLGTLLAILPRRPARATPPPREAPPAQSVEAK